MVANVSRGQSYDYMDFIHGYIPIRSMITDLNDHVWEYLLI